MSKAKTVSKLNGQYVTFDDAAQMLGQSVECVKGWVGDGILGAVSLPPEDKNDEQPLRVLRRTEVEAMRKIGLSENDAPITMSAAARICGKSQPTIKRWLVDGLLHPVRMPTGILAVRKSELAKFLGASALAVSLE